VTQKTAFTTYAERAREAGHTDLAKRLRAEQQACSYLIAECLRRNLTVSVHDGGEWCLLRSSDHHAILCALASTDTDTLRVRNADGTASAVFSLIYGNAGYEVIADHSDNALANSIMDAIAPKLDVLEAHGH
jgi:VCBS repeat-containing protein